MSLDKDAFRRELAKLYEVEQSLARMHLALKRGKWRAALAAKIDELREYRTSLEAMFKL